MKQAVEQARKTKLYFRFYRQRLQHLPNLRKSLVFGPGGTTNLPWKGVAGQALISTRGASQVRVGWCPLKKLRTPALLMLDFGGRVHRALTSQHTRYALNGSGTAQYRVGDLASAFLIAGVYMPCHQEQMCSMSLLELERRGPMGFLK